MKLSSTPATGGTWPAPTPRSPAATAAAAGAAAALGRRAATTADTDGPPAAATGGAAPAIPPRPPADPFGLDRLSTTGLAQRQGPATAPGAGRPGEGRVSAEDAATDAAVDALFSAIDTDGDGTLSADEVQGLHEALAHAGGDPALPPPGPPRAPADDAATAQFSAALQDLAQQYAQVMADAGASGTVTIGLSVSLDA